MPDRSQGPPEYKVYRSRRRPLGGLSPSGDLDNLRRRLGRRREREPSGPGEGIGLGRILKWAAVAIVAWLLLSLVLFLVSAQVENGVSDDAKQALSGGGSLFTGSNILVLGSDQRGGDSIDKSQTGPARADSIMVVHTAFGSVRKLSIPRDAYAEIPGHDAQKINAAYALGGPSLMIRTVESYLGNGLKINHLIEVDFNDFPKLIDALGGVTVNNKTKICAPPFDNFWKGFDLPKGKQHLGGTKALGYSRVRKNPCAPAENDLDRAARQQEVFNGIRHQLTSPVTFFRLPLVSWRAPKALRSDMHGPGLLALFTDLATSGSGATHVLTPSCLSCGPGSSLEISEGERRDAVQTLLKG
ncbi:MAG TPA: LCP family protein [Thermoleophilaceae bacterium]|jgi:LCP family protein required for cell wall assembly